MFYLKFGSSKKFLVFLHGWGADHKSFLWVNEYFDSWSKVFVDFPGFGQSSEPSKDFYVKDYVGCLKELLDKFEIDELVLIGHSFGGRVAIKFASFYQNDYKKFKLCLVDSAGLKPRRNLKYYFKVWRYKCCKKKAVYSFKHRERLKSFGSDDYKSLSLTMKKVFVNVVNEDLSSQAKNIRCETILLWGEKDKETKLYMAKKFHKIIENSQLYIIKNAGHYSFLDNNRAFLIILDRFIKSL